jgi:hypothetical protein
VIVAESVGDRPVTVNTLFESTVEVIATEPDVTVGVSQV